jgi:hypothetical protein
MKFRLILVTAGATMLSIGGAFVLSSALAGFPGGAFNDYEGQVERDDSADFGLDVDRRPSGKRVAHNFDLAGIPFSCRDGSTERRSLTFNDPLLNDPDFLRVRRGHFEGTIHELMVGYVLQVEGDLQSGGRARGVMRLSTESSLPEGSCYSGLLRWKAEKNT